MPAVFDMLLTPVAPARGMAILLTVALLVIAINVLRSSKKTG